MMRYGLPVVYALFLWWSSTGVIVYLDGLHRRTFRWTLLGATALLVAALFGLRTSLSDTSVAGAYCGFTCGLAVWGWIEVFFLMGPLTGPRKLPCPPDSTGWHRVGLAFQTILYHELAIAVAAAVVVTLSWGAPNQIATWTFLVLWAMRTSAKLNVFLGVRNLSEEFLPAHLTYLRSYLSHRPMNLLFPFCVSAATTVLISLMHRATADSTTAFQATGTTFVAALLGLAILEHWFLVVPLPSTALWSWSLKTHAPVAVDPTPAAPVNTADAARRSWSLSSARLRLLVRPAAQS
jgi:putative photosynthetic complex assembly protein 2